MIDWADKESKQKDGETDMAESVWQQWALSCGKDNMVDPQIAEDEKPKDNAQDVQHFVARNKQGHAHNLRLRMDSICGQ